jgi:hypothetical protein
VNISLNIETHEVMMLVATGEVIALAGLLTQ